MWPRPDRAADADKDAEGTSTDPFYIWTWNTDYQKILDEVLPKYLSEEQVSRIQIVNVGDSNIYQDKIDAILADPSNEQYPDIMLLEVGYVQKYVQSGQLMKAADLGITAEDMSNMYDYNLKLAATPTATPTPCSGRPRPAAGRSAPIWPRSTWAPPILPSCRKS